MVYHSNSSVLVTGADGFTGAHLIKWLLRYGNHVIGVVRDHKPWTTLSKLGIADDIVRVRCDIRDTDSLRRIITQYRVNRVFHFAAQSIVRTAHLDPVTAFKTNCLGTVSIMEACRGQNLKSVLIASTDKIYGEGFNRDEKSAINPVGVYDVSKACADMAARCYGRNYGIPVIITRCCNIYGEYDFLSRIVPNTIVDLKCGRNPVIFRNDESVREYIYVDDACQAYLELSSKIGHIHGETLNIGTGQVAKQYEIVKMLVDVSGTDLHPRLIDRDKGLTEIFQQSLNSDLLRSTVAWQPEYELRAGLERTWNQWK